MYIFIAFICNFAVVWLRLCLPDGVRRVASENIALRNQLVSLTRNSKRAPKLTAVIELYLLFWHRLLAQNAYHE
jgi:hypothetical protein